MSTPARMRLDKWLWAARFFKTRSLAKQAIEKGQVLIDGQRVKPSRDIEIGCVLRVPQGWDYCEVTVLGLAEMRGPAVQARQLYMESEQSRLAREQRAELRKLAQLGTPHSDHRPDKHERRQLRELLDEVVDEDADIEGDAGLDEEDGQGD